MSSISKSSRRQFVKLASGLLAVPFSSLSSPYGFAQAGNHPFRLVTVIDTYGLPGGADRNNIWMKNTSSDYEITDDNQLGTILSEFKDYKENMLVPTGLNMTAYSGGAHQTASGVALTGSLSNNSGPASGPLLSTFHESVDVFIGNYLHNTYGLPSPRVYPHLYFTDYGQPSRTTFCYDTSGKQIRSIQGINAISSSILGPQAGNTSGATDYRSLLQQDLLSLVQNRIQSVKGELLNASSEQVMDVYRASVEDLASQLQQQNESSNVCPSVQYPNIPSEHAQNPEQIPNIFKAIGHIFSCDLASSVTYAIGGELTNQHRHGFLYNASEHNSSDLQQLIGSDYHSSSHRTDDVAVKSMELVRSYQAREIKTLLDTLQNTPDIGGGSVLDNTVVFWTSQQAEPVHKTENYGHLLIAGKNTGLKGGYHYECSDRTHNDLLTTLARGVGAPIDSYGGYSRNGSISNSRNNGPITKMLS